MIKIDGNASLIQDIKNASYSEEEVDITIHTHSGDMRFRVKQTTHVLGDLYARVLCENQHYHGFVFPNQVNTLRECA